jgi:hypothetical protein
MGKQLKYTIFGNKVHLFIIIVQKIILMLVILLIRLLKEPFQNLEMKSKITMKIL